MSKDLPIYEIIPQVKNILSDHNILILQAPPGAGKSTVLPLELLNEPCLKNKKILMLEPRKLAARSVAARMASLLEEKVGDTVGYRVRFDNQVSGQTRIEVLTEGILTRMLQKDNTMEEAGLIIFDEFHERSLQADLALALCRDIQQILREDLKLIIMSATMDSNELSKILGNAPVLSSKGKQYPVAIHYAEQEEKIALPALTSKAVKKAIKNHLGDILVFLPGAWEINKTLELLEQELSGINILALYGDLPLQKQQEAILPDPSGKRKVILATSIAETSLTIEGITVVIDSGYSRVPRFDPKTGFTRLETVKVSKDAADQRAGRAGRTSAGVCYRLWTKNSDRFLQPSRTPEIMEADLAPLLLDLTQWGAKDLQKLSWLNMPPQASVYQAKELLVSLGAVKDEQLSEKGKEMLKLPTHPRIAQMLIEGNEQNLGALACTLAALLEERDPLPREKGVDITLRLDAFHKWEQGTHTQAEKNILQRIDRLVQSWRKIFQINSSDQCIVSGYETGKLLALAYPERIAQRKEYGKYRLTNGRAVKLSEGDPLAIEEWLAVAHMDAGTTGEGKIFMAAALNPYDLKHLMKEKIVVGWDKEKGVIVSKKELCLGDTVVESSIHHDITEEEKTDILCEAVQSEGLSVFKLSEFAEEWRARVMSLKHWRPEEGWPDVTEEALLKNTKQWLPFYLTGIRKRDDFKKLDFDTILTGMLPYDLSQKLNKLAPSRIKVPSGSEIKIQYHIDGSLPVLAVRLQEMFGLIDTPVVNEGKTKVLLHLLSPGYKPVQVTRDLKSFWQNTYPEVRKELKGRYSKHHWPEDPWTAEAVRGVKRKL